MASILFVGIRPSRRAKTNIPFCQSTRSGQKLGDWIDYCVDPRHTVTLINISDTPDDTNQYPIPSPEAVVRIIKAARSHSHIIAVGAFASIFLSRNNVHHFSLPHPSGLNRTLNDEQYVNNCLNNLKKFIESTPHDEYE